MKFISPVALRLHTVGRVSVRERKYSVTSSASPKFLSIYCTALRENMSDVGQWKPVVGMLVISFAFAIVNLLLKKMIDQGTNNMVIATYRLSSSAIFLAPIAYFWER
jgi:hypothetical protein